MTQYEQLQSLGNSSTQQVPTKAMFAGAIGNLVEWYDFAAYGFLASVIAIKFFPPGNPAAALLGTFAIFGIPFLLRPLSGVAFGYLGDKFGRRRALVWTIVIMTVSTTGIGLLPTYSSVGILAPLLLVICRVGQGIGAGGEFVGAATFVLEHTPYRRRGIVLSVLQVGTALAYVCVTFLILAIVGIVGPEGLADWGWRVVFLIMAPVGFIALFIRSNIPESPVYEELKSQGSLEGSPLTESMRSHKRLMTLTGLAIGTYALVAYILFAFLPAFVITTGQLGEFDVRLVSAFTTLLIALSIPLFGLLADRFGHHEMLTFGCLLGVITSIPAFILISRGDLGSVFAGFALLAVTMAVNYATAPLIAVEVFDARIRYTSSALAYNISIAVLSGTAPYVAQSLVTRTGDSLSPSYYIVAISVIALAGSVLLGRMVKGSSQVRV